MKHRGQIIKQVGKGTRFSGIADRDTRSEINFCASVALACSAFWQGTEERRTIQAYHMWKNARAI